MANSDPKIDWREHGVKIIRADQLDSNTPQTPGMDRAAAITRARTGANKLWAGTVTIHANAKTGAHHHGLSAPFLNGCGSRWTNFYDQGIGLIPKMPSLTNFQPQVKRPTRH